VAPQRCGAACRSGASALWGRVSEWRLSVVGPRVGVAPQRCGVLLSAFLAACSSLELDFVFTKQGVLVEAVPRAVSHTSCYLGVCFSRQVLRMAFSRQSIF
jgi:hypothetical protein